MKTLILLALLAVASPAYAAPAVGLPAESRIVIIDRYYPVAPVTVWQWLPRWLWAVVN